MDERNNILVYVTIVTTLLITFPANHFIRLYQRSLGIELGIVGSIAAAGSLIALVGHFAAGALSDRKGRKRLLLGLVVSSFLYPVLLIYTQTTKGFLFLELFYSIIQSAFWTIIIAYLYDTNTQHDAGKVYSRALIANFIANLIGPVIGGAIIEHLGYHWLFTVSSYIAIIPLVTVFLLKTPNNKKQELSISGEIKHIIDQPRFIKIWTAMALISFSSCFFGTFFPIYLYEQLGLNYTQVGLFFTAGTIVLICTQPLLGWLADKYKSRVIIPANMGLMTIMQLLLSISMSIPLVFIGRAFTPVGIFGARVKGAAMIAKLTPNEEHAMAQALFKSSSSVGWTVMNAIAPTLIAAVGYLGVFRGLAVLSAITGVGYLLSYRGGREEGNSKDIKTHHTFHYTDSNPFEQHRHA